MPNTKRALGIDISHWHPVTAKTMPAVLAAGATFVGLKATEGFKYIDPTFREHRRLCKTGKAVAQIALVIHYHFARPGSPVVQAEHLLSVTGELGPQERLCLDLEGEMPEKTPSKMLSWLGLFFDRLSKEHPGRKAILYTSANVWESFGNPQWSRAGEFALWLPRYNKAMREPRLPRPWAQLGWDFWQWTDGKVPFFSVPGVGAIDGNYFRSDEAALRAWMNATSGLVRTSTAPPMS